jgi:phosphonopyruvate decarboxylase
MAISPVVFYNLLRSHKIDFFTGVPDSLLKELCLCIEENVPEENHVIAANEGNSIALATGYYLATGKIALVYMQNSGIGNAINPLLSLCDPEVYSIPMIILIGWRGEPGVKDEPQHVKQGRVQNEILKSIEIPYDTISKDEKNLDEKIENGIKTAIEKNCPFAFIIQKGVFDIYEASSKKENEGLMTREEALKIILENLPQNSIVVSTTGKTSREIFEIRENKKENHSRDFLTVGSMGHCSSIALGIAIGQPKRPVVCIDGDGALIMHMGSLSTVGKIRPKHFYHILINNYVHESVGGQKTSAANINIPLMVKSNGYLQACSVNNITQLKKGLCELFKNDGPGFLEIKVKPGSRDNLGRPTISPNDNKISIMNYLKE